jgi:ABC-type multidrug transport system fused ATPase/permease subunit
VQNGRIVQRGTHSVLLGEPGIYADLNERQFAESAERKDPQAV